MFFEFEKKSNPEKNKKLDDQEVLQMLRKKGVENETNAEPGDGEPDGLENHEPQDRPTLNKVTEETRRVVPEVEKPKTFRPGGIPLRDTQNIEQVVKDVYSWLGDRAETFSILFSEYLESKKNE